MSKNPNLEIDEIDFREILAAIWAHKIFIVLITSLFTAYAGFRSLNIEKRFSFYYDFPGNLQVYDIKDSALEEIFERITQDIFNETLAKW